VAILSAIQKLACKSLVIVNTKDILWQWQKRAETFLGENYPVGQIGDGNVFDVSPYLTIATAQTLHSRYDDLEEQGFFDAFSFVCLDECHHATAETYNKILNRFSSRYRVGVSATPDKTGDFDLAVNVLGPIIHNVRPDEVDTLQKPTVVRVPTLFGFRFRGHKSRYQRSNYGEMIQAIITDPDRNGQIVKMVMENQSHHQLLVSKRLEHLEILEDLLLSEGFRDPIYKLTGKDSSEDREHAVACMSVAPGLLLSTLADEALDIPILDRLHFPSRRRIQVS
jgi:superfamily II DNA or RNA helicase